MEPTIDLAKLAAAVAQQQARLRQACQRTTSPQLRADLQALADQAQDKFSQLMSTFAAELERLESQTKQALAELAAAKQVAEAAVNARAQTTGKPAARPVEIDPHLGVKLRDLFLAELTGRPVPAADKSSDTSKKPTAGKDSFEWEKTDEWEALGI